MYSESNMIELAKRYVLKNQIYLNLVFFSTFLKTSKQRSVAYFVLIVLGVLERTLSLLSDLIPVTIGKPWLIVPRIIIYFVVTMLRYALMIAIMTGYIPLFMVIVSGLAIGQLIVEVSRYLIKARKFRMKKDAMKSDSTSTDIGVVRNPSLVNESKYKYLSEIQQMMFVFGEVQDPLIETTMLIEDILRSQVVEICIQAAAQAQLRGSRFISSEDLIFLIRHDRQKVSRLTEFLSWKDVRKNVKDREDAGDDIIDETEDKQEKTKKAKIKLFWELADSFAENIPQEMEDTDDEELYAKEESLRRLKAADDITKKMTRDEYVHYSECRQASFTYRKGKRFRDWINIQAYIDMKANDDIIDILGFLAFEMVLKLTETALQIKQKFEYAHSKSDTSNRKNPQLNNNQNSKGKYNSIGTGNQNQVFLFSGPQINRTPLLAEHIQEAFRQFQYRPQPFRNFRGGLQRTNVSLI
ncbi:hypothetical protein BB560_004921 [Smittium megazygosporum]|uniref:Transcription initiation protein SPT3 n=1 Tax=Smittium megazygosporum TaxID=133381 RepID=A0A2T9Z7W9_9FUNG|nr:hypothetical protein BB560_004921 [Smittium megazygosporum]